MERPLIDCLIIGYNEMDFIGYESKMRMMGTKSGAYRSIEYNFINSNEKFYSLPDIYNELHKSKYQMKSADNLSLGNFLSNTIAYLGTYLNRRDLTFSYINSFQDEKEDLKDKLLKDNILTIAITTTLYVTHFPIEEIIKFIRQNNKTVKIIVGGPYIAAQSRSMDKDSLNYLFKLLNSDFYINSSQGELALVNIIKSIKTQNSFENINNIIYKQGNCYITNSICQEDNKLEDNYVDWSLFKDKLGKFAIVRTAISCPYSCAYCEYPQHAGKYHTMEISAVQKELDSINNIGTVESINFIDDTFNIPFDRFKDILKMMIKNKYKFRWNSFLRCQYLDEEAVELMRKSGCEAVYLGIESGNDEMLINMNKTASVDKYRKGIDLLKKNNIITIASFLVGFPGETEESIKDTLNFIHETQPDFIRIHLWYCSVLTQIWKKKDLFNITGSQFEWSHNTMNSQTACDMIDYLIKNLKSSVYIPQHSFDSLGVMNLIHRGHSLEEVKRFISAFDEGMVQKRKDNSKASVSVEIINKMKSALGV